MATGTVKWFSNQKGYGFIIPDQGVEDIFVHFSVIEMDGYRTLKPGQKVEFDITQGPKGLHAANLKKAMVEGGDSMVSGNDDRQPQAEVEGGDTYPSFKD